MTRLILACIAFATAGLVGVEQAAGEEFEFLSSTEPAGTAAEPDSTVVGQTSGGDLVGILGPGCCHGEPLTCGGGLSCCERPYGLGSLCGGSCGWQGRLIPYMWLSEMYGEVTVRNRTADVGINTRELLDILEHNTHMAALGRVELQRERLGLLFDGYYVYAGLGQSLERIDFSSNFRMAILELALTYELEGLAEKLHLPCGSRLDLLAGGRYWLLEGGLTVTGQGPLGLTASADGDRDWVDPIIGGRIRVPVSELLTLQVRGDVGGFGWGRASDFTWNVEAVVEYRCSCNCALWLGYRVLDVDQQIDEFGYDMNIRGPLSAVVFEF